MSTRIAFNGTPTAGQIAEFINLVEAALTRGRRLKAKLDAASSGNDWTAVETEVGGMTPGTGQTLWSVLSTAIGQLDSPQVAELARLDKL